MPDRRVRGFCWCHLVDGGAMNKREREAKEAADKVIDAAAARIVKTLKEIKVENERGAKNVPQT